MNPELWKPGREWEGQDAFLIGGGPSLKGFSFRRLAGKNVIGCNDAYHLGPEIVSICAFGDASWWHRNRLKIENFPMIVTNCETVLPFNLPNVRKTAKARDGLHPFPVLGWNYSTGAMAINIAVNLGAKRIFLLGYDLCRRGNDSHWHSHTFNPIRDGSFARFINGFERLKRDVPKDVKVINVTDGSSKLQTFPRMSFADFYKVLEDKPKQKSIEVPQTAAAE